MIRRTLAPAFALVALMLICSTAFAQSHGARERLLFDAGWKFQLGDTAGAAGAAWDDSGWRTVELPHDWSIEGRMDAKNPMGTAGGYLPAGVGWYRRAFAAPAEWQGKVVEIEFEGVYMNATVYLNGEELASHPYGYTGFFVDLSSKLRYGAKNVLAVRVDNSKQVNSRWYSGSGIYRHVWMHVANRVHVPHWGVAITTAEAASDSATVRVHTQIANGSDTAAKLTVNTILLDAAGKPAASAQSEAKVAAGSNGEATQEIKVGRPALWSPEAPHMYRAVTRLLHGGKVIDEVSTSFGIRTLRWSAAEGLLVNGKAVKLAGGAIHHDNGPLGAAAFDRAEERKLELLKAAGFNAIRTAHNPPSPAYLDAADRLGLLVIDEAFDCWEQGKNTYDYSVVFKDWWQRDIDALVLRDRNHPSVVMWSIGNEVNERGKPDAVRIGNMLAGRVRVDDPSRPVTEGVPDFWDTPRTPWEGNDGIFSTVDIAGYNYMFQHTEGDHRRLPQRIMVATESYSHDMFNYWTATVDHPYILGDFLWTAIDYLGESGIGRSYFYTGEDHNEGWSLGDYPWHGSYCGDLDLVGFRKPRSHYRNIVWDRGEKLYMSVREPTPKGKKLRVTPWGEVPSSESWTWPGQEGKAMDVELYSRYEKVVLYLNGKQVGEAQTGREQQFKALLHVPYTAGELKVVGFAGGKEAGHFTLRTADKAAGLRLTADHTTIAADGEELAFINVEVVDKEGNVQPNAGDLVHFSIAGPGVLIAVGTGDVNNEEPYVATERKAFGGRALAVVRSSHQTGEIKLKATAEGLAAAEIAIQTTAPKTGLRSVPVVQ